MCNEELGFILMLRTEHKMKIDVDSRIFSSSGFQPVLIQTQGWMGRDGGKDRAALWGG